MSKNVMFLLGDPEYFSHESMPAVAGEVKKKLGVKSVVSLSSIVADEPDFKESEWPGLEALADADAMVIFTRFRRISNKQAAMVQKYLVSGRPVVGLRTSTHAFKFADDSPYSFWNEGFGFNLFGTPWRYHYGHESETEARVLPEKAGHPIMEGVPGEFHLRSWLYDVLPLPDSCEPLMEGTSVGESYLDKRRVNPIAWTNKFRDTPVFATTMGHPDDFKVDGFRKVLLNGIKWALDQ